MAFNLRIATTDDIQDIVDAYLDSWRGGYEGLLPEREITAQLERRRDYDWSGPVDSATATVTVAMSDGRLVGVVQATELSHAPRDLPEITMLYVRPEAWGRGVASALLTAGTDWIAERGHRSARLRVVEGQARARRFYERAGWRVDDRMPAAHNGFFPLLYYRRDDLTSPQGLA